MRKIELNQKDIPMFIELYQKYGGVGDIVNRFKISRRTIHRLAISFGLKKRGKRESSKKYNINHSYFDIIDCQEKAYIIGFLYADGNCRKTLDLVSMNLAEKDKYILDKMNILVGCNKPLGFIKKQKENRQNQFIMKWADKRIVKRLNELGVVPKKTLILEFPKEEIIPKDFIRHFVRGYFDGDGSIYIRNTCGFISFCGTKEFMDSLSYLLKEVVDVNLRPYQIHPERNKNTYQGAFGGRKSVLRFLDWIYMDSTIHLNRKHERYILLKNVNVAERNYSGKCSVGGCNEKYKSNGFCKKHHNIYRKEKYRLSKAY